MADLNELAEWTPGIYQLETDDPVQGGPDGIDNLQARQLANRTAYLKALAETLVTGKLSKSGDAMTGKLLGKAGGATPLNANDAGFGFNGDSDTGLFSPADGVLQLASNGQVFFENNAQGSASFKKGVRVPKGAPGANDASAVSGYTFDQDGDTGLFAEGGTAASGSDLVLRIDGAEIARVKSTGMALSSGAPSAPTAAPGTNTTQIANTAFVQAALAALAGSAPATLDTLNELAAALGNDPNFATTITNLIAGRVSKSGDAMTGKLLGKAGAATPNNTNDAGFGFNGDPDTGLFSPADGVLQLASNGEVFFENNAQGSASFKKGVRVPKGAPGGNDASAVSGYTFDQDGDTGLFAEGGTAASGSDLVLRIDGAEVGRFTAAMRNTASNGWLRLSNGMIIQWGQTSTTVSANTTTSMAWTFPVAFPSACLFASASPGNFLGSFRTSEYWTQASANGFCIFTQAQTLKTMWFAIGY